MRGIVLAGGSGTRLGPLSVATSKHLLPIFDKPMIFYPISSLMMANVREILLICRPDDLDAYTTLLGDGSRFGINLDYATQSRPEGIAQAFAIGREHIGNERVALILGDNFFHGPSLGRSLRRHENGSNATVLAYAVADPRPYAVIDVAEDGGPLSITEKPENPKSSLAVTGMYFYPPDVVDYADSLLPSARGEYEITDINAVYLSQGRLDVEVLPRGTAWMDMGTCESLNDASNYVRVLEQRQGGKIGCLEEIAWRQGWIEDADLLNASYGTLQGPYSTYLATLLADGGQRLTELGAENTLVG